jgi:hypothetical protein
LLLASSVLMFLCGRAGSKNPALARFWKIIGGLFLIFSIDEAASIHEVISTPLRTIFGIEEGFLYFAWVIPAAILILSITLWAFRFWVQLPRPTRMMLVVAVGLYLAGSVGVELLEADYFTSVGFDFGYTLLITVEETFEKLGLIVLVYALLKHWGRLASEVTIKVKT